jgi:hypothetical protein
VAGGVFLTAEGPRRPAPGQLWLALAALAAGGALGVWGLPAAWLDWQPDLAGSEPWRVWSAAWVHWSPLHLGANLAGVAVLAALGWVTRLPSAAALAWGAAWPLTQLGLALRPELTHYGGLSGVLHAGVTVAALWLVLGPPGAGRVPGGKAAPEGQATPQPGTWEPSKRPRRRGIGTAIALGLALKLWLEKPWGPALTHPADWDIAIAPLAHATGAAAGLLCATIAWLLCARQSRRRGT